MEELNVNLKIQLLKMAVGTLNTTECYIFFFIYYFHGNGFNEDNQIIKERIFVFSFIF